jgi:hypothetical protein
MRKLHRICTLLVGIQLVIWAGTGFAFSWFDFARVRGTADRSPPVPLPVEQVKLTPAEAATRAGLARVIGVELRARAGAPAYLVKGESESVIVDAVSGNRLDALSQAQAEQVARAAFKGEPGPLVSDWVTAAAEAPDVTLPAWRIKLGDARRTDVFVDPKTGAVIAWRNGHWRWFDRLWSLHVIGWANRDNPAHWPMRLAGALAVLVVASGVVLLVRTLRPRRESEA